MRDFGLSLDELIGWPAGDLRLIGSEEEGDGSQSDDDADDQEQGDESKDKSTKEDGEQEDDDKSDGSKDRKIAALEDEKTRHYNARVKAEKRVQELEAEVTSLKDNGVSDEGKAELTTLRDENTSLKARLHDQALEIAFTNDKTYTWHNPLAALKLADLSDVEIDDDGKVSGLASAAERLATQNPWLLASKQEDGEQKDKKPAPKQSGQKPRQQQDKGDDASRQAKTAQYRSKYAGLRR